MGTDNYQMLAKTFAGLEEVLKTELEEIGASDVEVVERGVNFTGSKEILYKANFCCRTALRVFRNIGEFKINNTNDLYDSVFNIAWEDIFEVSQSFTINSTVNSDSFNNAMFVSLKAKDAIVDRFRSKLNKRPSFNTEDPDFKINIHATSDTLNISLDSSGESLHKRGYRVGQTDATTNEVLAAGVLKTVGWKGQTDFYDTMCGSGTLPIEAALIARNIPPGIFRQEFAFETWKDFDAELFEKIYNDDYEKPFEHIIYASDISAISIKIAEKNAKGAGVLKSIQFKETDFAEFEPPSKKGLLVINPPHPERMNERKVEPVYSMIGDQLKRNFTGFESWVFSAFEDGFRKIGLRPSQSITLPSGSLECSLRLFEVYDGSKRDFGKPESGNRRGSFSDHSKRDAGDFRRKEGFNSNHMRDDFKRKPREEFSSDNRGRRNEGFSANKNSSDFKRKPREEFNSDNRGRRNEGFSANKNSSDFKRKPREEFNSDNRGRRNEGFSADRNNSDFKRKPRESFDGENRAPRKEGFNKEGFKSDRRPDFKRIKHDDFKAGFAKPKTEAKIETKSEQSEKPKRPRIKKDK